MYRRKEQLLIEIRTSDLDSLLINMHLWTISGGNLSTISVYNQLLWTSTFDLWRITTVYNQLLWWVYGVKKGRITINFVRHDYSIPFLRLMLHYDKQLWSAFNSDLHKNEKNTAVASKSSKSLLFITSIVTEPEIHHHSPITTCWTTFTGSVGKLLLSWRYLVDPYTRSVPRCCRWYIKQGACHTK